MTEILPRLYGIIDQLPVIGLPPRLLNVGCGDFPCAATLSTALPGWMLVGVDRDGDALRCAGSPNGRNNTGALLIQADARDLPVVLGAQFGVILVRHPDLFRSRAAWLAALVELVHLLAPDGVLVITLYAPEEVELIHAADLLPLATLDEAYLPRVDIAGRDRFVRVVAQR